MTTLGLIMILQGFFISSLRCVSRKLATVQYWEPRTGGTPERKKQRRSKKKESEANLGRTACEPKDEDINTKGLAIGAPAGFVCRGRTGEVVEFGSPFSSSGGSYIFYWYNRLYRYTYFWYTHPKKPPSRTFQLDLFVSCFSASQNEHLGGFALWVGFVWFVYDDDMMKKFLLYSSYSYESS